MTSSFASTSSSSVLPASTLPRHPAASSSEPSQLSLPTITSSSGFVFPAIYSFPPFFTRQPNPTTWEHQADLWQQLVLSYCRYHRKVRLNLSRDLETSELFYNASISRRLKMEDIRAVLDRMVSLSLAEYDPPPTSSSPLPSSILIYFLPPHSWASLIHSWIISQGLTNSIMTLYELTTGGDLAHTTEFYELDPVLLRKALAVLVKQGKAQVFKGSAAGGGGVGGEDDGVKFF